MADKIRKLINSVRLTGKLAEFEYNKGTNVKGVDYVSMKGVIQFGDSKTESRRFEKYTAAKTSKGLDSKAYEPDLTFAENAKSIAKHGVENATEVKLQGELIDNVYVNSEDKLIEGIKLKAGFFNDVNSDDKYKGEADIEGYIRSVVEETKGEDEKETGRLKVALLTTDFFGNVVPLKNIIVPKELKDAFLEGYEEGQTAKLYIDYVVNKSEPKTVSTGGLGKQRQTEGKSYVEMIVTGAAPAVDEDDEMGISEEAIRIALAERQGNVNKIKEEGYKGKKTENSRAGIGKANVQTKAKTTVDDIDEEDMPF